MMRKETSHPTQKSYPGLPEKTSVVVIGGGIAGVSAALYLAQWGIPVTLCEKGHVAAEQSSRNWGWIRKQGRKAAEMPLMLKTMELWLEIASSVDSDIGYRVGGITYIGDTDKEMESKTAWLKVARQFDLDSRLLSTDELDSLLGQSARKFKGGIYTPSDAYAEPKLAVPAMARLAQKYGADIHENCAVRTLLKEGGRVTGVVTERGTIRCDAVILAGGAWSRTFLENQGVYIPQLAVRSSAMRTADAPFISESTFGAPKASIRRRMDGGYTVGRAVAARFDLIPAAFRHFFVFTPVIKARWKILKLRLGAEFLGGLGTHRWSGDEVSPFEKNRVLSPEPDDALLSSVHQSVQEIYPQLQGVPIAEKWASCIDVTPDETPFIDHVKSLPGLVVATGLSGHGFGLGPGVGLLAAQLATGKETCVDAGAFRLSRFKIKMQNLETI